jgi:hypothetical protein
VLALQAANQGLQEVAGRLQQQNEELAAQLRAVGVGSSPAKRHMDSALLQAMIRKQDGCAQGRAWCCGGASCMPRAGPCIPRLPAERNAFMLLAALAWLQGAVTAA